MRILSERVRLRITSAEPERIATKFALSGIVVSQLIFPEPLVLEVNIYSELLDEAIEILERNGANYRIVGKYGSIVHFRRFLERPILVFGILLLICFSMILPGRVLFIRVSGNEGIPAEEILEYAEKSGISFGSKTAEIRSEEIKNLIMGKFPQIQWIGVTTNGCITTIHVEENLTKEVKDTVQGRICSIIASRDGLVTEMTVYRGTQLCVPGQTVYAGEMLISGYTDCGLHVKGEAAEGEVFAYTLRENTYLTPTKAYLRGKEERKHTCIKLRLGKKVIKFCNHSGIWDAGCVKMYSEEYWTLPGGLSLPVSLIKETVKFYECSPATLDTARLWLPEFADAYVKGIMAGGTVLDQLLEWTDAEGYLQLHSRYACHEMIGQVKYEENLINHAEDNRANSECRTG